MPDVVPVGSIPTPNTRGTGPRRPILGFGGLKVIPGGYMPLSPDACKAGKPVCCVTVVRFAIAYH